MCKARLINDLEKAYGLMRKNEESHCEVLLDRQEIRNIICALKIYEKIDDVLEDIIFDSSFSKAVKRVDKDKTTIKD